MTFIFIFVNLFNYVLCLKVPSYAIIKPHLSINIVDLSPQFDWSIYFQALLSLLVNLYFITVKKVSTGFYVFAIQ